MGQINKPHSLTPPAAGSTAADKLGRTFFELSAVEVATNLPGVILVRRFRGKLYRARIVEVYLGPKDLASHASKGRTLRTEVLFGPAGHAYVYFIYGMHWMFNIVVGVTGDAEAVLVRSAEPLDGWQTDLSGPAKLAAGFNITSADNGRNVTDGDFHFTFDAAYQPRLIRTRRIGVDYAKH